MLSLGRSQDVRMADLIYYIMQEPQVRSLLIQIDDLSSGMTLIRALRAASRHKLVLAVKAIGFPDSPLSTMVTPKGFALAIFWSMRFWRGQGCLGVGYR